MPRRRSTARRSASCAQSTPTPGTAGHTVQVPASGTTPAYTVQMDPNTGETFKICGPNSAWRLQNQMGYLPPRGTINDQTNYQLTAGLKGDLGVQGLDLGCLHSLPASRARSTQYVGYISAVNYAAIMSAPNYGKGYTATQPGVSNKTFTCTSGLNPFAQVGRHADAVAGLHRRDHVEPEPTASPCSSTRAS